MSDGTVEDSPSALPPVVDTVPLTPELRLARALKMVVQLGDDVLSVAIFSATVVALIVPPVIFFVSGLWSTITYINGVWTLWHEIQAWRITDMLTSLVAVDTSSRFALASVSYFALVFSFIVLFAGLLGRRWQHFFVVPGILLCAPCVVIFALAATLSFSIVAARWHVPGWLQYPLTGYVIVDALLLAALLLDLRPRTRYAWLAHRRRPHEALMEAATIKHATPLPLVRFGPSQPLAECDAVGTFTQPATVLATSSPVLDRDNDAQPVNSSVPESGLEAMADAPHKLPTREAVSTSAEAAIATGNRTV